MQVDQWESDQPHLPANQRAAGLVNIRGGNVLCSPGQQRERERESERERERERERYLIKENISKDLTLDHF